jgi:hypothetical protein
MQRAATAGVLAIVAGDDLELTHNVVREEQPDQEGTHNRTPASAGATGSEGDDETP